MIKQEELVGIERDAEVAKDKLDTFIQWLMREKGPDLYRSKGALAVKGMSSKFVLQAVHMQFGGKPQEPWKEGEKRCCKMVFIGKNLKREELNKKFEECLAKWFLKHLHRRAISLCRWMPSKERRRNSRS